MSLIDAEARFLLNLESQNRHVKESTGASLYGPDAGKHPAWFTDLIVTLETQRILKENAQARVELSD